MSNDFNNLVDDIIRYLKYQADLSGGKLFLHHNSSPNSSNAPDVRTDQVNKVETQPTDRMVDKNFEKGITSSASFSLFDVQEEWMSSSSLDDLNRQICTCMKCPLGKTRTNFVFGVGNPSADIMLIGEAPGADEDRLGEPFVGRAGQLLNKILEAIGLKREEVYICNILKCRPPNNRDPLPSEVEKCEPYLHKQIELIKPKVILVLGRVAAQTLLRTTEPLGQLRQRIHIYMGIPMIVVYHTAALLRNPNLKKTMWEDMKKFRAYYDELKTREV